MKSIQRIAALVALLTFYTHAAAQLPLNTGYNHQTNTVYTAPGLDNYWINIASYPAGSTAVGPSRVIVPLSSPSWAAPLQGTAWISGWPTYNSPPGANGSNPAYTIFRKCFCLLPGFKDARLSFRTRADDAMQVWFNTITNQLLPPVGGNFAASLQPRSGGTDKGFRVGKNCLYALVEDQGVAMGFIMEGSVNAIGLLPTPAAGAAQTFAPCSCQGGPTIGVDLGGPRDAALERRAQVATEQEEQETVNAIIKYAEARRLERQRDRR